jgi:hypothetical protein
MSKTKKKKQVIPGLSELVTSEQKPKGPKSSARQKSKSVPKSDQKQIGELKKEQKAKFWDIALNLVAIAAALLILIVIFWQVLWKLLTPDTLIGSLPLSTVYAVEEFQNIELPHVRGIQALIGAEASGNLWEMELPEVVEAEITKLVPARLVQSWQSNYGVQQQTTTMAPLLIVESSLRDSQSFSRDREIKIIKIPRGGKYWYQLQTRPGRHLFTTDKELLKDYVSLKTMPGFSELLRNVPEQYWGLAYLDWTKLKPNQLPVDAVNLLTNKLGQSLTTIAANGRDLELLTYVLPRDEEKLIFTAESPTAESLPLGLSGVDLLVSGVKPLNRLLAFSDPNSWPRANLEAEFFHRFSGLTLDRGLFSPLVELLNSSYTYGEYGAERIIVFSNISKEAEGALLSLLLAMDNYQNPIRQSFQLRDGDIGYLQVPATKQELEKVGAAFVADTIWGEVYLQANPNGELKLATNAELLVDSSNTKSPFTETVISKLGTNADEYFYLSAGKIQSLFSTLSLTPLVSLPSLQNATAVGKIFMFEDGIQIRLLIPIL